MIRLNNMGIGGYQFYGAILGQVSAKSRLTGEIQILKGLHKELANNRETFMLFGKKFSMLNKRIFEKLKEAYGEANSLSKKSSQRKSNERENKVKNNLAKIQNEKKLSSPRENSSAPQKKTTENKKNKPSEEKKEALREHPESPEINEHSLNDKDQLTDPVINYSADGADFSIDDKHQIFKIYKGSREKETIKTVLLAMKLSELPQESYIRLIKNLIMLKS